MSVYGKAEANGQKKKYTLQTHLAFGQSNQNPLTKSDTNATPTPMLCRHGSGAKSEESEQLTNRAHP